MKNNLRSKIFAFLTLLLTISQPTISQSIKIRELPSASTLSDTDVFPVAISSPLSTRKVTVSTLKSIFGVEAAINITLAPYNADNTGVADSTAALQLAVTTAATLSPRGVVHLPCGTYKVTSSIDITGLDGLTISGDNRSCSIIDIAHATTDLFTYSDTTNNITIKHLQITSSVSRTAGWVIHGTAAYDDSAKIQFSEFTDLFIQNQENGFWFSQFRYIWIRNVYMHGFVGSGGIGIKFGQTAATDINQGVEAKIINTNVIGQNLYTATGADPTNLDYGVVIEDCDAVYILGRSHIMGVLENGIKLIAGGHGLNNHFFDGTVVDMTRNSHVVNISGSGPIRWITFNDGYYASAGQLTGGSATARGFNITSEVFFLKIQNAFIRNNKATGIYISTSGIVDSIISTNFFSENGDSNTSSDNHNIVIDIATGKKGPTILGNRDSTEYPSTGVGLRTTSTAEMIAVRDNFFPSGYSFGIAPYDSSGNRTNVSISTISDTTLVATDANTTEKDLWTKTIKGGTFWANGQGFELYAWGTFASNANVKTLRAYFGANSVTVNDVTTSPSGVQWTLRLVITYTGASTGKRIKSAQVASVLQGQSGTISLAETWANDIIVKITGQNGTASAGDINVQHVILRPIID